MESQSKRKLAAIVFTDIVGLQNYQLKMNLQHLHY